MADVLDNPSTLAAVQQSGSSILWPYLLAIAFVSYVVINTTRSYWRLRHFRGPWLAGFSNLWYINTAISGNLHLRFGHVCDRYGSIARIGPNILITCDEELLRKLNAVRSPYRRGDWYKAFKFDADRENVFSEVDEERHARMRNKISAGYSGKDNPDLEPSIDLVIWDLIQLINKKYLSDRTTFRPMDFAEKMQFFTLDAITGLSLSKPFGYVSQDKDVYEYIKTLEENFPLMNFIGAVPFLARLLRIQRIQKLAFPTVKDRVGMGKIKGVARDLIALRFGAEKEVKQDMMGSFIAHGLTQAEAADESLLQILAGSDTTATVLRSAFVQIISNPNVYSRLTSECLDADIPLSSIISNSRALELPYFQACIKEALRHFPVATGLMPKVAPAEGATHNGLFIPGGTQIGLCAWNVHRNNKEVYGEDAGIYRPERWLDVTPEKLARMERTHELSFGFGRFKCLGERIAKVELNKVMFELMRRFEWSLTDPFTPWESSVCYGMFLQKGMWVRVLKRE